MPSDKLVFGETSVFRNIEQVKLSAGLVPSEMCKCPTRAALASIQWCSEPVDGAYYLCPECDQSEVRGHWPNCRIGLALSIPCECCADRDAARVMADEYGAAAARYRIERDAMRDEVNRLTAILSPILRQGGRIIVG